MFEDLAEIKDDYDIRKLFEDNIWRLDQINQNRNYANYIKTHDAIRRGTLSAIRRYGK